MNNIKKYGIIICTFILSTILLFNLYNNNAEKLLEIHLIDVGQGDSILIVTPNNRTILIDAGDTSSGPNVLTHLKKNRIKSLDVLIGTHPHSDHIGGLPKIIESMNIESFYIPPVAHTSKTFEDMLIAAKNHNLNISTLSIGSKIEFDEDISLYFLSPLKDYGEDLNNWSIVLKLDYLEKSFLFTGDMEYAAEQDIINHYEHGFLRSHLLKIAHHGSNSSSSLSFLNTINPDVALISCGYNNSYSHPHEEVINRLKNMSNNIYRTDYNGTVIIKSNGKEIWSNIKPYSYPN